MRRSRAAVVSAGVAVAALLVVACQLVAGIDYVPKTVVQGDGSPDEGEGGTSDDPCNHGTVPPIPEKDDAADKRLPPFFLAVRTLDLSPTDSTGAFAGLDLDDVCTCDTRPGSLHAGGYSCDPKLPTCDGDGGIDNRGAALFGIDFGGVIPVEESETEAINSGKRGLLVEIWDWNGEPNDREINLGMIITPGISDGSGCGTPSSDGLHYAPGWCGRDKWDYPPTRIVEKDNVRLAVVRGQGYVNDYQVVFKSDDAITLFFDKATLDLGSPMTLGRLEPSGAGWKMSGILAGRIATEELLGAVGQFLDPFDPGDGGTKRYLCESQVFAQVKAKLCDAVDIASNVAQDFQGGPCNAVSTAVRFTAEPATLGNPRDIDGEPTPCAPSRLGDKSLYKCPSP